MEEQIRHFVADVVVTLVNEEIVRKTIYSYHQDSLSPEDTLSSISQIIGDLFNDAGSNLFDAPIENVKIVHQRLVSVEEYDRAPNFQRM